MEKIVHFLLLCSICTSLYSQNSIPDTLVSRIHNQLIAFPQEKIYLHADKPYYLSGEKIWLRV